MDCGDCTVCCTVLEVSELRKKSGVKCEYCTINCSIYYDRPESCKSFLCAYRQAKKANVVTRPDNMGVVFEKLASDIMFGTVNSDHKNFKHLNGQVGAFLKEGINVVLSSNGMPSVFHLDDVLPEKILKRVNDMVVK